MQADEYEREHMQVEGRVRFRDRARQRRVFVRVAAVPALVGAMMVLGLEPGIITFMGVVGLLGGGLAIALSSYRVVLTDSVLHVQYGLRTQRIPVGSIEDVSVAPYRATDAMIGRGLHAQSRDGSVRCFRADGQRQTVRITWRHLGRAETLILGSDRAAELLAAIESARSAGPPRVRVEHDPEMREALEEVERLLRGDDLRAPRRV